MSGDLDDGSYSMYAAVDTIQKKEKESVNDEQNSSNADVYAVVDKTKKKRLLSLGIDKNYDEQDSSVEPESIESHALGGNELQPTHSVLKPDIVSEGVLGKTPSFFDGSGDHGKKWLKSRNHYKLGFVILITALLAQVVAFIVSAGVSYALISKLKSDVSLIKIILSEVSTIFPLTFDLNELNKTCIRNHLLLKERISLLENATLVSSIHVKDCSGQEINTSSNCSTVFVKDNMTSSCGNITGGLTRVAVLNNETRPLLCINDFMLHRENTVCIRSTEDSGCSSIVFPVENITFTYICGTVEAFWFGSPDGFTGNNRSANTTVNNNYVDGISLTYGNTSNMSHIWTFIADGSANGDQNCPHQVPQYVGNNYSCLNHETRCESGAMLCYFTFFRQLQHPVSEDIELRLCRDQHRAMGSEGILLGNLEIYVW